MNKGLLSRRDNLDVWVVVPLYNESQVIGDVVCGLLETFPNVVCVDDGSTDSSAAVALGAGAYVVKHPINLGQGAAIQTGFDFARRDISMVYTVTFDSDGQHQVEDAQALIDKIRSSGVDVVLGSRFLDNRTRPGIAKRAVLSGAIAFTRWTTRLKITDSHNGLRAFNRHALDEIRIRQDRMAHASEILAQVSKMRLTYAEIPVHVVYTDYSRAKGQSIWNAVNILIELALK